MQVTFDSVNLKPPRPGRWSMPMVLAIAAHLLLIAALTWGVRWKQDSQPVAFEAELWSAVAQKAAPREVIPPPPPPVETKVEPKKAPPEPKPKAEPTPPDTREADIAIAQAKKKKEEAEKREAEKKAAKDKAAKENAAKEKAAKEQAEKEKQKVQAAQAAKQKALDDKIKQIAEDKKRLAQEKRAEAAAAKAREDQMRRILGQAGASGKPDSKEQSQGNRGPSAAYGGRVQARVRPNVLLTEDIPGNPKAEVEVTTAPDGTIISRRLARSSGNAAWDKAAIAAIDRTGTLPRDTDGRVPSPMIIELRPRD